MRPTPALCRSMPTLTLHHLPLCAKIEVVVALSSSRRGALVNDRSNISELGVLLRQRRRERRRSLRDLADEIGVSLNTLSRVERGHIPDLVNFQRIVDWLDVPADAFLEPTSTEASIPEVIARHLRADPRLTDEDAERIAELVEDMYANLVADHSPLAIHLRSAKTFTPAAGALLSEILNEMRSKLRLTPQE
jgi:transcriptional regulator with XRE-family HTH domain